MAGGGLKKGHVHGKTDEIGFRGIDGRVSVHDIQATILHLLGFVLGFLISYVAFKNKAVAKTISIEVGMQNSGLGVVLAQENFANPMTAIPAAISSLIHSLYGSFFVFFFKDRGK